MLCVQRYVTDDLGTGAQLPERWTEDETHLWLSWWLISPSVVICAVVGGSVISVRQWLFTKFIAGVLGTSARQCIPLMSTWHSSWTLLLCEVQTWLLLREVTWERVAPDICGGQGWTAKEWMWAAALLSTQAYFFSTFCTGKLLCGSCPLETCLNCLPLLWSFVRAVGPSKAIIWSLSCSCLLFPQVSPRCPDGTVTL